jgi:hypothetical protein
MRLSSDFASSMRVRSQESMTKMRAWVPEESEDVSFLRFLLGMHDHSLAVFKMRFFFVRFFLAFFRYACHSPEK